MQPVLFETLACQSGGAIGVMTLNAPARLNALDETMVLLMAEQLQAWQQDPAIVMIWLQGSGERAFCAGGDVKGLQQAIAAEGAIAALPKVQGFFENEYRLDYRLHRCPKPIVVWGHGVVMGGGIGLLVGGSHRIVTPDARFAMPEITIGLYPDVGGSYFLPRMPGNLGLFVGLTGAQFGADDALYLGLADYCLPAEQRELLISQLQALPWTGEGAADRQLITTCVQQLSAAVEPAAAGNIRQHQAQIEAHTQGETAAEVTASLLAWQPDDPWLQRAIATFKQGCPVTAHLVFRQCRDGKNLTLEQAFQQELCMSMHCGLKPDFPEGVRALLVDKDRQPQWRFPSVAEVPAAWVDEHFSPPWEGAHPLADLVP